MKTPIVSIIMPAYRQGEYVTDAIESVRRQNFQDWELVIVDDGSPDNVAELVRPLVETDTRIKFYHTSNNGVSWARNFGVSKSSGEYLLFLDADDTIEQEYLESCVHCLSNSPEVLAVYCQWKFFGECVETPKIFYPGYKSQLLKNHIFITAMIRRDKFNEIGGFDESMKSGLEDWEFWIRYLEGGGEVVQLLQQMFNYRIKSGSRNYIAHKGMDVFETQLYILSKHRELYARVFGSPLFVLDDALEQLAAAQQQLVKIRRKYDSVFYRRLWRLIKRLFPKNKEDRF